MAQIFSPDRIFNGMKNSVVESIQDVFPVETNNRILTVSNVAVEDSKLSPYDYASQKEIKINEKDYVAPVYGDLKLIDKVTGEVISEKKKFRLMDIPMLTDRYSYILGGNEYAVDKQLRMKPGIYTREKDNGELESQFNLAKGGGRGFKILMDPSNGIFKFKIGTSNPPLYSLLNALGTSDDSIRDAWGEALFNTNVKKTQKTMKSDVMKIYKSIFSKEAESYAQAETELKGFFDKTILSEETSKRTLGKGFAKVEPETLLLTSKKLLQVYRGEAESDDRDSLIFKNIYDVPDLVKARIDANKKKIHNSVSRVMDKKDNIIEIISKDVLNKPVRDFFVSGSVSHLAGQSNPLTMIHDATKVTSLGEGAIGDTNTISDSMRDINTSHAGILDPVATPESEKIGIDLHLALGSSIEDKEFKSLVVDRKTGKAEYHLLKDVFDKNVAFPDQYDSNGKPVKKTVTVMSAGEIKEVKPSDVDYSLYSPKQMFGYLSNLIPFSANIQGNRAFMANKMLSQAIPLKYREEPLIQTKMPQGGTFEKFIGNTFSTLSDYDGTVSKVSESEIVIKDTSGKTHKYSIANNFPLNDNSFITASPKVKVGDSVTQGQILADTNFTKDGTLAMGTNLRAGVVPFKSSTFEDGYVISESAAKKLTSEHLREVSIQIGPEDKLDLKSFQAHFPTSMTKDIASKLDEKGVVQKGTILNPGDTVIAHLQKTEASEVDSKLGKLSKKLIKGYRNNAQVWDSDFAGEVVDVYKSGKFIKVLVRSDEPMQLGDKIVNRYGAKGIVSLIVPDNEMPVNKEGLPLEVILSPSAIPGRINPSQILEAAASKVAKKRGKPLKIDNFAGYDSVKEIKRLLKENKLTDKEELIDPTTGQSLGKVMVGDQYYLKLMHQVKKKINARGVGPGYDVDLQPSKGGHTSARAMDRLTWNSLIAHGARENLYEMTNYKAEKNPELWRNVQLGLPLPAPKTSFVFDKLLGYMAAGGVNVKKDGNKLMMLPLTDADILSKSNGEIDDAKVIVSKNLRPVKDGLFDEAKTGGIGGKNWTHVSLAEPLLNPVMENAAMTLLDMTQTQLTSIISGSKFWDDKTRTITDTNTGLTAGKAIEKALKDINVSEELSKLKGDASKAKGATLDKIHKKMRLLKNLENNKLSPDKAYMIHNVPILPPAFRPMYPLPSGSLSTAPINYLYRDMILVNRQLKEFSGLPDAFKKELRGDLYKAVKAAQGLGDPLVQRGEKKIVGAIELIKGDQPKRGFFQSTVFSKNQDLSGSSTVTPSVEMNPDEILLPRDMAWNLYQPFITKELVAMGHTPLNAATMVKNRDPQANVALEAAVKDRPLFMNRAPSLHKFSILAFQPKLYDGRSIGVHPLVVGGFNMDFDGDTAGLYVPISSKAVEEAKSLMPSKLMEHAADGKIMLKPSHDIMTGLFYLTRPGKDRTNLKFSNMDEALKKYKTKEIEVYDDVTIGGKKTSIGRELVKEALPEGVEIPKEGFHKGSINKFMKAISSKGSDAFLQATDKLSRLSSEYNLYSSISIGLDDLEPDYKSRDSFVNKVNEELSSVTDQQKRREIIFKSIPKFHKTVENYIERNPENALSQLMKANGKPGFDQFKQLISTPFAVTDSSGKALPLITTKSFAEGLPVSEYWTTAYGSRRGMIQKRMETAEPGYFSKQVLSVTIDNVISGEDCGVKDGVVTSLEDKNDVVGRYEAKTNKLIDEVEYTALLKSGKTSVVLRSPLKCLMREGTCSKCYGLRENGQPSKIGDNVGALAGQFLTEPATQGSMKAFHTGAVLGSGASTSEGLERLQQLTLVPDYLKDKATLAAVGGVVEDIEVNPAGGQFVTIDGHKHLTGFRNLLKVKKGDRVTKGQALTDGPVKPQELLELRGIEATQKYLVDSLKETYKNMGNNISNKLLETVVRSTTNLTTVIDPGDNPNYLPGEQVSLNEIRNWNSFRQNELDTSSALGYSLAVGAGPYRVGHILDKAAIEVLKDLHIDTVLVDSSPIKHAPSLVGINLLARMGKDWLAKLNTNYIQQGIVKGVQTGDAADLSSYNPTGPYVIGTQFGKGKDGKY